MNLDGLRDERDVLLLSLEDLEREHDSGDLSDEDYVLLRDRYTERAAQVLRALDGTCASPVTAGAPPLTAAVPPGVTGAVRVGSPAETPARTQEDYAEHGDVSSPAGAPVLVSGRRSRRRWSLAIVGVLVVVVVASVVLVIRASSSRLPGQTVTGSVSLSRQQLLRRSLAQAQVLEAEGEAAGALKLYHQVLEQDPTQEEALAESGWLEYQAGVQAKDATLLSQGQDEEGKAERADPSAFTPHLYMGSMLLVEGEAKGAVTQYRLFLADSPPSSVVRSAELFIDQAFRRAGLAPPPLPTGS
ncbi:MAG: hypothetical protein ABSH04_05510 [Acidimicrobiales bacterium]|jgi:tetratricopeptide (TPR) repeat protein